MREMIPMALRTGMRLGEIVGLQWSSIDWEARNVSVRHSRCDRRKELGPTNNNRERHIPLDIDVYEMLSKRKHDTGYVFVDFNGKPFTDKRSCCKKSGLRRITWHVLRHTFASHLAMRGVPLPVV